MKNYLDSLRNGDELNIKQQLSMIIQLSIPAVIAQISSIIMQYIDAAMVGRLGTDSSAAIGLVSTTTWLIGGIINSCAIGFNVQIAHKTGAGKDQEARSLVKHGLLTITSISLIIAVSSLLIRKSLPLLLGGNGVTAEKATLYFTVFALTIPVMGLNYAATGMLQCSGNMKTPSVLNIMKCALDVLFNFFCIFPTAEYHFLGFRIKIHGLGLGIIGAALGTSAAEIVAVVLMLISLLRFSPRLKLRKEASVGKYSEELKKALRIALPVGIESAAMGLAYVASTSIVAPLGTPSIAAHSFSITAESLCYMPGYGIGVAATTIIGQALGAKRYKLTKKLGRLIIIFGMSVMTISGVVMFLLAPQMISILTPDKVVQELGVRILRTEAFAEPMYAASIVISGIFRGLGSTLVPSLINLLSMWGCRIPLSAFLSRKLALHGVWIAMSAELCLRGLLFLLLFLKKTYGKELKPDERKNHQNSD